RIGVILSREEFDRAAWRHGYRRAGDQRAAGNVDGSGPCRVRRYGAGDSKWCDLRRRGAVWVVLSRCRRASDEQEQGGCADAHRPAVHVRISSPSLPRNPVSAARKACTSASVSVRSDWPISARTVKLRLPGGTDPPSKLPT